MTQGIVSKQLYIYYNIFYRLVVPSLYFPTLYTGYKILTARWPVARNFQPVNAYA